MSLTKQERLFKVKQISRFTLNFDEVNTDANEGVIGSTIYDTTKRNAVDNTRENQPLGKYNPISLKQDVKKAKKIDFENPHSGNYKNPYIFSKPVKKSIEEKYAEAHFNQKEIYESEKARLANIDNVLSLADKNINLSIQKKTFQNVNPVSNFFIKTNRDSDLAIGKESFAERRKQVERVLKGKEKTIVKQSTPPEIKMYSPPQDSGVGPSTILTRNSPALSKITTTSGMMTGIEYSRNRLQDFTDIFDSPMAIDFYSAPNSPVESRQEISSDVRQRILDQLNHRPNREGTIKRKPPRKRRTSRELTVEDVTEQMANFPTKIGNNKVRVFDTKQTATKVKKELEKQLEKSRLNETRKDRELERNKNGNKDYQSKNLMD